MIDRSCPGWIAVDGPSRSRHVLGADEQVHVAAGASLLVADAAFQRGVFGREGVEHRGHRCRLVRCVADAQLEDGVATDEVAELGRDADADVHRAQIEVGAARTDSTGGRCWAISRQPSPSSVEA